MGPTRHLRRVPAVVLAGALLFGACGGSSERQLPQGDPPAPAPGGVLVQGGLTVAQARSTDAVGILAVRGFLVDDGAQARLCEALAESFPPQCGGASVGVSGYHQLDLGSLSHAQGTTWTDGTVVIFGELIDGTLVAAPDVIG